MTDQNVKPETGNPVTEQNQPLTIGQKYYYKDRESSINRSQNWKKKNRARNMFNVCKNNAKKRGLYFELTQEYIEDILQPMKCSVTNVDLTWENDYGYNKNPFAPSLDRIDNDLGYSNNNVRVVCYSYNTAKSNWSDEVVQKWARNIK